MKILKPRSRKSEVLKALRAGSLMTIAEISNVTGIGRETVRESLIRLIEEGYAHRKAEMRNYGTYEAHIYAIGFGPVGEEIEEPLINQRDRARALEHVIRTIDGLRPTFNPSQFDPFRVLRAQVGAA